MIIIISKILIVLIALFLSYLILKKIFKRKTKLEAYIKKSQATRRQIQNINKHLKIADASKDLHEVRVHARAAMKLIKRYGLVNHYRNLLKSRT